ADPDVNERAPGEADEAGFVAGAAELGGERFGAAPLAESAGLGGESAGGGRGGRPRLALCGGGPRRRPGLAAGRRPRIGDAPAARDLLATDQGGQLRAGATAVGGLVGGLAGGVGAAGEPAGAG